MDRGSSKGARSVGTWVVAGSRTLMLHRGWLTHARRARLEGKARMERTDSHVARITPFALAACHCVISRRTVIIIRASYRLTEVSQEISTDTLATPEKFDDRLIASRPFGVRARPFAVACCDIILTTPVRYTALCVFHKTCRIATVTGGPPLYRLITIPRE